MDKHLILACLDAPLTVAAHADAILALDGLHPEAIQAVVAVAGKEGEARPANAARMATLMHELTERSLTLDIEREMRAEVPDAVRVMGLAKERDRVRAELRRRQAGEVWP